MSGRGRIYEVIGDVAGGEGRPGETRDAGGKPEPKAIFYKTLAPGG